MNASDPLLDQTRFFYGITPDHILEAVESSGVRCTGRVLQLNSLENRVYEVEIDIPEEEQRSRYDAFRVIKFYRPGRWSREQILEEHQFLQELAANDLPVVPAVKFESDGRTLHEFRDQQIWFAIYPKIGGRLLDELEEPKLERLGRTIARLHIAGAAHAAEHRLRLTSDSYGRQSAELLLKKAALPEELRGRYQEVVNEICSIGDELLQNVPCQRVHGDLHCGNVLWDRDQCLLVDFDDMLMAPVVQDVWLIVPGRDQEALAQRQRLLSGYEELRSFNYQQLGLIETLRALRIIRYSAWVANRWDDPAFPAAFPAFGSNEYWRDHLYTLQEQLQAVRGLVWE